jgi:hypothetical protein
VSLAVPVIFLLLVEKLLLAFLLMANRLGILYLKNVFIPSSFLKDIFADYKLLV